MIIKVEGLYETWCTVWSRSNEKLFEGSVMTFYEWDEHEEKYMMMLNGKRYSMFTLGRYMLAVSESSLILIERKDWDNLIEKLLVIASEIKFEKITFKKLIEIYFGDFYTPNIIFSSNNLIFDELDQFELVDEKLVESETLFIENEESGLIVEYNMKEKKAYLQDVRFI